MSFSHLFRSLWSYLTAKIQVTLIPLLASALLLASCGDGVPLPSTPGVSSSTAPSVTSSPRSGATPPAPTRTPTLPRYFDLDATALQGQQVTFWYVLPERLRLEGLPDPVAAAVQEFDASNGWGIQAESRAFPTFDALFSQLESSLSTGERPDLITGYNYQLARLEETTRLVVDLTPYVADPEWGFSPTDVQDFTPVFWQQDLAGSPPRRLGVPFYRSLQVLYYNQTWARELGFSSPPRTTAEFREQVCAAAAANDAVDGAEGTGGWVINTNIPTVTSWYLAHGGEFLGPGGGYQLDRQAARETFTFLHSLYAGGCSWASENAYPYEEFANRRALLVSAAVTSLPFQSQAMAAAGNSDEWAAIPFPAASGDPVVDAFGPALAVLKSEDAAQMAAWLLAKSLLAPQVQASLTTGFGALPVSASAYEHLALWLDSQPQWAQAAETVSYAHSEPALSSWSVVRFTFRDAAFEVYRPSFTPGHILDLVNMLVQTVAELEDLY